MGDAPRCCACAYSVRLHGRISGGARGPRHGPQSCAACRSSCCCRCRWQRKTCLPGEVGSGSGRRVEMGVGPGGVAKAARRRLPTASGPSQGPATTQHNSDKLPTPQAGGSAWLSRTSAAAAHGAGVPRVAHQAQLSQHILCGSSKGQAGPVGSAARWTARLANAGQTTPHRANCTVKTSPPPPATPATAPPHPPPSHPPSGMSRRRCAHAYGSLARLTAGPLSAAP